MTARYWTLRARKAAGTPTQRRVSRLHGLQRDRRIARAWGCTAPMPWVLA